MKATLKIVLVVKIYENLASSVIVGLAKTTDYTLWSQVLDGFPLKYEV